MGDPKSIRLLFSKFCFCFWLAACVFLSADKFAFGQIVNGDFSGGATGWTSTTPGDSTLVYTGGQLTATGNNAGGGGATTVATQTFTAGDPGFLSYLLVSYSSTDVADWDWPIMQINGTNFRLDTAGALVPSVQNAAGVITNGTGATNVSNFTTLAAGSNTIGPGVFSVDSIFGAGVAVWDDIDFQELTQSPGAQSVLENYTLTLAGASAPQVATNGPTTISVTLTVTNGIINLGSPGSVTITGGADGTATVTFNGTPAQINTAMDGLIYTPNIAYSGADTLVFAATGGGITDTDNIPITVTPGNPSLSVSKTATFDLGAGSVTADGVTDNVPAVTVVTYTYVVTNDGDQFISNVSLADAHGGSGAAPVPDTDSATLTDNGTTGDSTNPTTGDSVWDTLAPGDVLTVTATYIVTQNDIDTLQ